MYVNIFILSKLFKLVALCLPVCLCVFVYDVAVWVCQMPSGSTGTMFKTLFLPLLYDTVS